MLVRTLSKQVITILENAKAEHITLLQVAQFTTFAEYIIICSATSKKHTFALSQHLKKNFKAKYKINIQGLDTLEWLIVDLLDIVVHIMLPGIRNFYQLEKIWYHNF